MAYGFLLFGIVIEFFIGNIFGLYMFYLNTVPSWFIFVRSLLALYPAFHYSKAYGEICLVACRHYDLAENRWLKVIFNKIDLIKYIK